MISDSAYRQQEFQQITAFREPQLTAFRKAIPYNSLCGEKRRGGAIMSKHEAILQRYLQTNYPMQDYIVFEIKHDDPMKLIHCRIGPTPTMIVRGDSSNYDSDLFFRIDDPISPMPSEATRKYYEQITAKYIALLGGILGVGVRLIDAHEPVRNPLSDMNALLWVSSMVTSLLEFAESIQRSPLYQVDDYQIDKGEQSFEATVCADSRNCSLFEAVRRYAYEIVGQMGTEDEFYQAVEDRLIKLNDEEIPKYFEFKIQNIGELKRTARSISRWTWKRRSQFKTCDRGAMGLPTLKGKYRPPEEWEREVKRYQQKSADRTNEIQKAETRDRICAAVKTCLQRGIKTNPTNIARETGLTRHTVYAHIDVVNEVLKEVLK